MTRTKHAASADSLRAYQSYQEASDWRSITNDKEKYAAYLCSREWCEKREAVRERAGGKCERCGVLPMDACHHLTYERKYAERLEDLQAICNPCHEFTHGKIDIDPLDHRYVFEYLVDCKSCDRSPLPASFFTGNQKLCRHAAQIVRAFIMLDAANMPLALDALHKAIDFLVPRVGVICLPPKDRARIVEIYHMLGFDENAGSHLLRQEEFF